MPCAAAVVRHRRRGIDDRRERRRCQRSACRDWGTARAVAGGKLRHPSRYRRRAASFADRRAHGAARRGRTGRHAETAGARRRGAPRDRPRPSRCRRLYPDASRPTRVGAMDEDAAERAACDGWRVGPAAASCGRTGHGARNHSVALGPGDDDERRLLGSCALDHSVPGAAAAQRHEHRHGLRVVRIAAAARGHARAAAVVAAWDGDELSAAGYLRHAWLAAPGGGLPGPAHRGRARAARRRHLGWPHAAGKRACGGRGCAACDSARRARRLARSVSERAGVGRATAVPGGCGRRRATPARRS